MVSKTIVLVWMRKAGCQGRGVVMGKGSQLYGDRRFDIGWWAHGAIYRSCLRNLHLTLCDLITQCRPNKFSEKIKRKPNVQSPTEQRLPCSARRPPPPSEATSTTGRRGRESRRGHDLWSMKHLQGLTLEKYYSCHVLFRPHASFI